jgi:NADH dehydrogenase FAD-containing subunit
MLQSSRRTHTLFSRLFFLVRDSLSFITQKLTSTLAAAVGTVSVRSLVEPIRKFLARLRGHFVQAKAVDIVMSERLLEVEGNTSDGDKANFYIPSVSTCFTLGAY